MPDHATIARFRQRDENAIVCVRAGMVEVGVIAIDGTQMHANASEHATRGYKDRPADPQISFTKRGEPRRLRCVELCRGRVTPEEGDVVEVGLAR